MPAHRPVPAFRAHHHQRIRLAIPTHAPRVSPCPPPRLASNLSAGYPPSVSELVVQRPLAGPAGPASPERTTLSRNHFHFTHGRSLVDPSRDHNCWYTAARNRESGSPVRRIGCMPQSSRDRQDRRCNGRRQETCAYCSADRSVACVKKVLDAHVVFENQMLSFMTFDEEHHRLAIAQLPQPAARTSNTGGLARSAYSFSQRPLRWSPRCGWPVTFPRQRQSTLISMTAVGVICLVMTALCVGYHFGRARARTSMPRTALVSLAVSVIASIVSRRIRRSLRRTSGLHRLQRQVLSSGLLGGVVHQRRRR
jgi:hypothetical protein